MSTEPIAAGPNDVTVRAALDAGIAITHGMAAAIAEVPTWEALQKFATLIAATEREECAKECEETDLYNGDSLKYSDPRRTCAEAIRMRSNAVGKPTPD